MSASMTVGHVENYGTVKVFRIISNDGKAAPRATNNLGMN